MEATSATPEHHGRPLWLKILIAFALLVVVLALVVVFFPWDTLRGPLNRYVTQKIGRHFEITRHLDVKVGRTTRIIADGIEIANPEWAKDPRLVQADGAEIEIALLPLLERRIELPLIELHRPQLGLQVEGDGRRSWAMGHDTSDAHNIPQIGALRVDQGSVHYVAAHHGADIHTDFAIDTADAQLPLSFKAKGVWEKENFTAQGRTGNVLYLSEPLRKPFPIQVDAAAAATTLHAQGSIDSLATLEGADARFNLQGHDLAELYKLIGVVLPATPRYVLRGVLSKQGEVWHARQIDAKVGNSDLSGELSFDRTQKVPVLTGKVQSRSLDYDDLAPLVGLPEQARSAAALPQVKGERAKPLTAPVRAAAAAPGKKVLPESALDLPRLKAMEADVQYEAERIVHVRPLPLNRARIHVRMKDGVLQLDPMNLGVGGGTLAGRIRIDGNSNPAVAEAHLTARALEFNDFFPKLKVKRVTFGKVHGDIQLKGRGNSVAQMLGTSSGEIAMLMGQGQISNLVMEIAGLDAGEVLKFLAKGDRDITLRCAAVAFDVNQGVMNSRALVLDTTDTVIYGNGQISLASEGMDLTLYPYPKDMSILAFRSPLKLAGSFSAPKAGPDKGALTARAGLTLALSAVNPLLGLATTVETGPGKDKSANCGPALREAYSPYQAARVAVMNQPPGSQKKGGSVLGGPAAAAAAHAASAPGAAAPGPASAASAPKRR
jgi:AsmA family protein